MEATQSSLSRDTVDAQVEAIRDEFASETDIDTLKDFVDSQLSEIWEAVESDEQAVTQDDLNDVESRIRSRIDDFESQYKERNDAVTRERAQHRQRTSQLEEQVEHLTKQVHYRANQRKRQVLDVLFDKAIENDGKSCMEASEIADRFGKSERTARSYMDDLSDEWSGVDYRQVNPHGLTTKKRLYLNLDTFLDNTDEYDLQ